MPQSLSVGIGGEWYRVALRETLTNFKDISSSSVELARELPVVIVLGSFVISSFRFSPEMMKVGMQYLVARRGLVVGGHQRKFLRLLLGSPWLNKNKMVLCQTVGIR